VEMSPRLYNDNCWKGIAIMAVVAIVGIGLFLALRKR